MLDESFLSLNGGLPDGEFYRVLDSMGTNHSEFALASESVWLTPESPSVRDSLQPTTIIVSTRNCLCCELSGELVILSAETGTYFGLDRVGAFIWQMIQEPATLSSIRDALMNRFEVDQRQCEEDLKHFVRDLLANGLAELGM